MNNSQPTLIVQHGTMPATHTPRILISRKGQYHIRVKRPDGVTKWVGLGTADKLEAMRRLEQTGVAKLFATMQDKRFKERVAEVLSHKKKLSLQDVVDEWLADKESRIARISMAHPRAITRMMVQALGGHTSVLEPTPIRISAFINTAPSLTMRRRRLSIMDDFWKFVFDQGYRPENIAPRLALKLDDLNFDQMERKIKVPFGRPEFDALLGTQSSLTFWRMAFNLAWWLGLRMSDCAHLQWGSFCAVPGKIVVWQKKTRRRMELDAMDPLLGAGVIPALFEELKKSPEDAVYCFPAAHALYERNNGALFHEFKALCVAAGIGGDKTFHCFRKAAAQRWEMAGRSLEEIGQLLGHEGSDTTNTNFYLEKKSP